MAVLTNIPNNTSARDWRDTVNALIKRIAALEAAGVPVATPAPTFTTQPSITPTSGTAGSTVYAATPGTVSNGSVVSRAWLLNGTAISTGVTAVPASAGTLTYQETASGPGGTTTSTVQVAAVTAATVTPTPAPSFTSQPSISPNSGTAGTTTFTATAGNVSNGSVTARSWTINGTVISTGITASPASAGTLTYQETATGPGGTAQSTVQQVTVATAAAAAPAFTSQPTVSPSTGTAGTTTYTATPGAVSNGTITSRAWSLNGSTISTGLTAAPAFAGTLTYQEFATGAGGSVSSSILTRTVANAATSDPSLNALSFTQTAARKDTAYTGVPIGKTAGSTLTATSSDSTSLTTSTGNVVGTFSVKGSKVISVTEALSGYTSRTTAITLPVLDAKLAVVADSIGGGYGSDGGRIFWNQMPSFPAFIVTNGSGNGVTISGQISNVNNGNYDAAYDATKTCVAYIEVGTNTLGNQGKTASAAYSEMTTLIGLLKAKGWYVVVATVLPRLATTTNPWTSAQEAERITYNNAVRTNSGGADGIYDAAANPTIGDNANATGNTALYVDGLHLSGLAHVAYGQGLSPTIVNMALSAPRAGNLPAIAFAPNTASATEGATVSNLLNVTRNGVTGDLVVNLTYTGTSASGSDYTATTSVTVLAASSSVTFDTVTIDDAAVEDLETIIINAALAAYPSATASKTISLSDNDVALPGAGTAVGPNLADNATTYSASKTSFGQARTGGYAGPSAASYDILPAGIVYTMEGWFKSSTISTGVQALFGIGNRGWVGLARNTGQIIALYHAGASKNYGGTGTAGGGSNPVVTDGAWHHVAFVANGAVGVSLYLDGVLVGALEPFQVSNAVGTSPFQIGAFNSSSIFVNGSIDEVAVFTTARYTENFTPPTAPYTGNEPGLVALYHLDGNTNAAVRP
jgi:hypothetical protein